LFAALLVMSNEVDDDPAREVRAQAQLGGGGGCATSLGLPQGLS